MFYLFFFLILFPHCCHTLGFVTSLAVFSVPVHGACVAGVCVFVLVLDVLLVNVEIKLQHAAILNRWVQCGVVRVPCYELGQGAVWAGGEVSVRIYPLIHVCHCCF